MINNGYNLYWMAVSYITTDEAVFIFPFKGLEWGPGVRAPPRPVLVPQPLPPQSQGASPHLAQTTAIIRQISQLQKSWAKRWKN